MTKPHTGPLSGLKILEIEAIGPVPFCGMMLADLGAEIIMVNRMTRSGLGIPCDEKYDTLSRGRRSIALDMKSADGKEIVKKLAMKSDILMEGMRPGVMEKLGLGPEDLTTLNPKLIYARMTGWGQTGERAQIAGHDINYISLNGTLGTFGPKDSPPMIPLNMMGDYGGGGLFLVIGILAAALESKASGKGQVIDVAMIDGSNYLMSLIHMLLSGGVWKDGLRGSNPLDGGLPFYSIYETSDAEYMAVGALEPKFYKELLRGLDIDGSDLPAQNDPAGWDEMRRIFTDRFKSRTQAEWTKIFNSRDACTTPVLTMTGSRQDKINQNRGLYSLSGDVSVPTPAPRFSRTKTFVAGPPVKAGNDTVDILSDLGISAADTRRLIDQGIVKTGK